MLDFGFLPSNTKGDFQLFNANTSAVGNNWATWTRPRGVTMTMIIGVGAGGGGGDAVAGAASTAAGGGGGGSGGITLLTIPSFLLPEMLFVSVAKGNANNTSTSAAAGYSTYVSIKPAQGAPVANNVVLIANAGASGGKSSGATPGPVGTAATVATAATMPLGWAFSDTALAGQVGIIGSATTGAALTLPTTGLWVTGGTGGGGVPAISTGGNAGGLITGVAGFEMVPVNIPGGAGGASTPSTGLPGVTSPTRLWRTQLYSVGGTGGGSSGLGASTGSNGGFGGSGGPGSGGGGGGGAFTASTFGNGGFGGNGYVIIVSW